MAYFPDDVSQIPDNHPDYIPAPPDRRARLTVLLHSASTRSSARNTSRG
ncbi:hypothetical protein [Bifidobacterium coryneforme]|nr:MULTISPECIES: hypothetical protein [Bifidobacterium]